MKRYARGIITGIIISTVLMGTAFGEKIKKSIDVVYNSINITVNGNKVDSDNILYNGTTYVPLRAISEMLGKEVGWDPLTNTASINDKTVEDSKIENNEEKIKDTVIEHKNKVLLGEAIIDEGLSVTIEKIEYNGNDFIPNDPGSTSIYRKGFGVYYKIENNTEKTYTQPGIRFKLTPSKFEALVGREGYSHHPVEASMYIYPGETLVGFYQYTFEHDINISEVEVFMADTSDFQLQSFGTWLIK